MAANDNGATSKSQAVRDYLSEHPKAGPKEIVAAMKDQGIELTTAHASHIKSLSKKRKKLRRARRLAKSNGAAAVQSVPEGNGARKQRTGAGRPDRSETGRSLSANDLLEAKKLANALGGLANARRALELLERLL